MAALPLLLAGPLVRRVEPRNAAIWVALREAGEVSLSLWEGRQKSTGPGQVKSGDAPIATATTTTRRLGSRLHVALVRAGGAAQERWITPPLRAGAIYSYDVVFRKAGGAAVGLKAMGLLADDPKGVGNARTTEGVSPDSPRHLALGYGEDLLPSFATPPGETAQIRLAHASCRKFHGPGTDALSWLDDDLEKTLDKPDKRIQQLFLTGDQIYADDVPTCLLPVIHDLSLDVTGNDEADPAQGEEELPVDEGTRRRVSLAAAPPMRRASIVRRRGGFTSSEAQNHLLTFGEYAATYLLAWSPRVWRAPADEARCYQHARGPSELGATDLAPVFVEQGTAPPASDDAFRQLVARRNAVAFRSERQKVLVYAATVPKVARVLANVATYMIFDDHDVTDDWNLNASWRNRVATRALGRAVVRNALIAYTFFQAWGSDPDSFESPAPNEVDTLDHANPELLASAEDYLAVARGRDEAIERKLDRWFGFAPDEAVRAKFHYEARGSRYRIRVLDSRTRRSFPFSVGVAPPFLLGDGPRSSLDQQMPKGPRQAGTDFLLVVASTPVLGPELLERMLAPMLVQGVDAYHAFAHKTAEDEQDGPGVAAADTLPGAMTFDAESWPSNERGQHALLNRLAGYERVVVLGGDVHYGTSMAADWFIYDRENGPATRRKARIVQLTSSASRNAFETRIEAAYRGYHWANQWMFGPGFEGIAWKSMHRLRVPDESMLSLLRRARMAEAPALLPAWGWPAGTSIAETDDPDWSWRMTMLRDERPDAARKGPFEESAERIADDLRAAEPLPRGIARARAAAAIHQKAHSFYFAPLREVVFTNNVGIVTFEAGVDEPPTVIHTLLSTDSLGYPEDDYDEALVAARPLGDGAVVSTGGASTVVRTLLDAAGDPPKPYTGTRPPADA